MKIPSQVLWATVTLLALQLTACEAVKFVFKTGFWIGVVVVVAIAALFAFIARRAR